MKKIYQIIVVLLIIKVIIGITYLPYSFSTLKMLLTSVLDYFDLRTVFNIFSYIFSIIILGIMIFGLIILLINPKATYLNKAIKISIAYYSLFFIVLNIPSLIVMDFEFMYDQWSIIEIVRFFGDHIIKALLILAYSIYSSQNYKTIDPSSVNNVSDQKEIRFYHYLIDTMLILIISSIASQYFSFMSIPFLLAFSLIPFLYYLVLEFLFKQTIGKIITNTIVFTDRRSYLGAILIRTLCRHIPFEPLSFFGEGRWHDKLSKTKLIKLPDNK